MRRAFRTKDLLLISLLTLVVVGTSSALHLSHVSRLALEGTRRNAEAAAQEILALCRHTLEGSEGEPRDRLREAEALRALLEGKLASMPSLVRAAIVDEHGEVLAGSSSGRGAPVRERVELDELLALGPLGQIRFLRREGRLCTFSIPLQQGEQPFGRIQLDVDTSLVRREVESGLGSALRLALVALISSFLVALAVTRMGRRPLKRLAREIDRLRSGEHDFQLAGNWDYEVRELAGKLSSLGEEIHSDRLKLLGQKATLEHVMNQLDDAVLLVDPEQRIVFFNRAFRELAGAPLGDPGGAPLEDLLPEGHPILRLVEEAVEEDRGVEDLPCQLPAAGRFQESLVSVSVVESAGRGDGLVVVIEDLDRFRTLQELAEVGSRLLEMDELTSGIVHDVRNPLNSMSMHLHLLEGELESATPDARRSLESVREQIEFLDRVATGLLELLRQRRPRRAPVDLCRIVEAQACLVEAQAANLGIELEVRAAGPARVLGDEDLLRRVFANLLRNGLEALSKGGGELRVSVELAGGDAGEREVVAVVEDDGPGIPAEVLDDVGRRHFTTKAGGNGIGLSVVKRVVLDHGGRFSIDSTPGRGTRVEVRLPALTPDPAAQAEPAAQELG